MSKKSLALLLAVALLIGGTVGGTIAWLTDTTQEVTNTFSVGKIDIELWEHQLGTEGKLLDSNCPTEKNKEKHLEVTQNNYKIIPGTKQPKDPFVRVAANTEKCYLFIQVQPVNNDTDNTEEVGVATKYITYTVDDTVWIQLKNGDSPVVVNGGEIWYKEHDGINETAVMLNILKGEEVTYDPNLTKEDIDKVGDNNKPTLNFKAFAVQKEAAATALAAWNQIPESEYLK